MSLYRYGSSSKPANLPPPTSEFEILKSSHKFLREENEEKSKSWNDQLAQKYYENLYREFAVCDLKHYKSGNFAVRWRTESEVLSGAGETSCGNTRCEDHVPRPRPPALTTLELPFAYEEHGESKSALVKMVLCGRCVKKMMWKRRKEREEGAVGKDVGGEIEEEPMRDCRRRENEEKSGKQDSRRRSRNSRSQSPRERIHKATRRSASRS